MTGLVLLALGPLLGCALVRAWAARLDADLAWVLGPVLGLVAASWVVYGAGWLLGGLGPGALVASVLTLAGATVVLVEWSRRRGIGWPRRPSRWLAWSAVALAAGFLALNWYGILRADRSGTVFSVGNAWADIPFHASIVTSFAYRDNFPATYPVALGAPLGYPFLVDLLSGGLVAGGLSLRWSVVLVNVLLHAGFFCGFMVLVRAVTGSVRTAVLAGGVLLLLGNLGWLAVPGDVRAAGGVARWLRALPWDYTGESLGTQGRKRLGVGVYLGNPTFMFLLPRRSGAFGLALGMPALALAGDLLRRPSVRLGALLGLVAGLTPRVHAHTAASLAIIVGVWALVETMPAWRLPWRAAGSGLASGTLRAWALAAAVALVLAAPQVLTMRHQIGSFVGFPWIGWTGEPREAFAAAKTLGARLAATATLGRFWIVNGGLLVLLLPAAIATAPRRARRLYAGVAALWVVANLVRTQPWEWDNSSYFVYWQVGTVLVVAPLVVRLLSSRRVLAIAGGVAAFAGLVAGGHLSLVRTLQDRVPLWSRPAAAFADDVRRATPADAVVLTSNAHAEPVNALSGRQIVMGFSGWLANHGLDAGAYDRRLVAMFAGDVRTMRRLGVDHVVLGPWERGFAADHRLDLAAFADRSRFEVVLRERIDGQEWTLLRVRDGPSSLGVP